MIAAEFSNLYAWPGSAGLGAPGSSTQLQSHLIHAHVCIYMIIILGLGALAGPGPRNIKKKQTKLKQIKGLAQSITLDQDANRKQKTNKDVPQQQNRNYNRVQTRGLGQT